MSNHCQGFFIGQLINDYNKTKFESSTHENNISKATNFSNKNSEFKSFHFQY